MGISPQRTLFLCRVEYLVSERICSDKLYHKRHKTKHISDFINIPPLAPPPHHSLLHRSWTSFHEINRDAAVFPANVDKNV